MTWTSEDVYAKDLQPGDRFTSRWAGDHTVALSEACTVRSVNHISTGGLRIVVEMPSGDWATRIVAAGNRVFRWTSDESSESAPRFTLTDEKDPDHPGILDAERPDMVARFTEIDGNDELIDRWHANPGMSNAFDWDTRTTGEPEVAAAVKGLGPSESSVQLRPFDPATVFPSKPGEWKLSDSDDEHDAPFLPEALTTAILADRESTFDSFASAYAAEASEDSESEPETEATKVLRLGTYLVRRDELEADIAELRRDLSAMWGE